MTKKALRLLLNGRFQYSPGSNFKFDFGRNGYFILDNVKGEAAGTHPEIKQSYLRSPLPACSPLICIDSMKF